MNDVGRWSRINPINVNYLSFYIKNSADAAIAMKDIDSDKLCVQKLDHNIK